VHRALKHLDALVPIGARLIFGGGDFASDQGPIYSPAVFRRLLLPRLKRISEACRRHGLYHLFGTDGNVWAVAEDLYRQSDIDGHYEFDRHAGMRGVEVHARYPHIAMIGGMSSHTLHMGTPAEVAAETRACLAEARQTGKMIAGASNLIVPETPARNLDAMLDAIATFRC
jgi:uroporphyrinogen-III decarboxylase